MAVQISERLQDTLLALARSALAAGRPAAADPQVLCRELLAGMYADLAGEARRGLIGPERWAELAGEYARLLGLRPVVAGTTLVLDAALPGGERKEAGAYYTPESLVNALLDSALEPVIAGAEASSDPARALLALRICDPACGSGQFLVAAGRRLARALSRVRPCSYRDALREVVGTCLVGLDSDPTAALLCRVTLWLEARDFSLPLISRIRTGNGLLGAIPDLVLTGIPDAAFGPSPGDDAAVRRWQRQANRDAVAGGPIDSSSRAVLDAWCAAFFWAGIPEGPPPPTSATLAALSRGEEIEPATRREIDRLASKLGFFHWDLEHPGKFDVVLGNPPWERVKIQDKEWFAVRHAGVAGARNAACRERMIADLAEAAPALHAAFRQACAEAARESHFVRHSGRYPLCGRGDVNTYALFAETFRQLLKPDGRAGFLVPSGIATDHQTREFFRELTAGSELVSFHDFENRRGLFPEVDRRVKFALVTLAGRELPAERADFVFFAHDVRDLADPARHISLSSADLDLLNPNSGTCPIFRTAEEARLVRGIYLRAPVFMRDGGHDPWGASFCRMFDMANDSSRFRQNPDGDVLPLYEAKLLHQYDARWATFQGGALRQVGDGEKADPGQSITPRYWLAREVVENRLGGIPDWLFAFRDIARSTDERTAIAAILPPAATSHHAPLLLSDRPADLQACLLANFNSLVLDFVARTKVGGTHLTFFIVKQLPLLAPERYTPELREWIASRVVELTCTQHDLLPFGRACGYAGGTFRWDAERRFRLRCELDARFFRLYGIAPADVPSILATFPILMRKDMARYGCYRTQEAILAALGTIA